MEALYLFCTSLPLKDVWQDEGWKAEMELMQVGGLHPSQNSICTTFFCI